MSWPVLPLREHERPLTRLPKATFTFGLGPTVWLHEAIEYSAHKLIRQRKYIKNRNAKIYSLDNLKRKAFKNEKDRENNKDIENEVVVQV